jgi:hypothetical protein
MARSHRGNDEIGQSGGQYRMEKYHWYYQVQGYLKSNPGKEVGIQVVASTASE